MRRLIALVLMLLLVHPGPGAAELATETISTMQTQVVTVETIAPLVIEKSKDITAKLVSLTPQAMQLGLQDAVVVGKVEYQKMPDDTTRTKIAWHSIAINPQPGASLAEPLTPPMESQFLTKAPKEETGTQLTAKGDLEILTQKFLALKAKAASGKQPSTVVAEAPKEEEKRDNKASELTPTSTKGSAGGGSAPSSTPSEFNANLITTSWEPCAVRIAAGESRVYEQHRPVDKDESGAVVDSGACVDTGVFYDAAKVYGGECADLPDYANAKVYEQYQELATVDGKPVTVRGCTTDFNKFAEIKGTTTGKDGTVCGYRHDFVASRSIEQEILYYTKGTETIELTPCQDGAKAYNHFETELTCSYIIDGAKGLAFKQTRIGFTDASGGTSFATECRPIEGDTGKAIQEEYCDPKYEHDFVNNVSYYRTRSFYLDSNNQPAYVTECARSATNSFPHIKQTDTCGLTHDDANLRSQYYALTKITTPDDGTLEIAPCSVYGAPVAYVRTTDKTVTWEKTAAGTYTLTLPATLASNSIVIDLSGAGGGGGGGQRSGGDWGGSSGAGGGAGYGFKAYTHVTSPGTSFTVVLGGGGAGGSLGWDSWYPPPNATSGSGGGQSTFGALLVAGGGSGGRYGNDRSSSTGGPGANGAASGGGSLIGDEGAHTNGQPGGSSLYFSGGSGGAKSARASGYSGGGGGGASLFATGAAGGNAGAYTSVSGTAGSAGTKGSGGGGGGAAFSTLGTPGNGGKGGDGYCQVTYYTPQYLRADGTTYAP